ncbi:MAG: SPOR domain-containing protein [Fibromonadales bacterium]|nr:SPOR domain-containing protein [Fibromonadales bacterium]
MRFILLFAAFAFANDMYSQAQKLYSQKNFEAAAKSYAELCPKLEAKEKKICLLNEVKALIESDKIDLARAAEPKIALLLSQSEPSDSLYAELSATDAKLQVMLNQPVRAVRSWNAAQASASKNYFSELFVLCQDIVSAFPGNGLAAENCNKIKPADTTLISIQRKKVTVLATATAPPPTTTATTTSNSPPATSQEGTQSKWYIQLGAFGTRENAEKLVADFKKKGVELYVTELTDRKLFAVRTGFFATQNDAKTYAEQKIAPADYKIYQ